MAGNTMGRIGDLLRSAPPPGSDDASRAAWFDQKADTFDAIAEDDRFYACEAAELAHGARSQARRLRGGGGA